MWQIWQRTLLARLAMQTKITQATSINTQCVEDRAKNSTKDRAKDSLRYRTRLNTLSSIVCLAKFES